MNPLRKTALILAASCTLAASAFNFDLPTETINGKEYYVYRVTSKETVYSITRRLGITRDQLIAANPAVKDGLRAGDTLIFPTDTDAPAEQKATSVAARQEAPPFDPLQPETVSPATAAAPPMEEPADTLRLAVILPFMLESENITKSAENFTNFYRGFMLGIETLGQQTDRPIKLLALDSEGSADKVEAMMTRPELVNSDFIIAPEDSLSINTIAEAIDSVGGIVLNLFAVKNPEHHSHLSVCQGNISHDRMYLTAIREFCKANSEKKVILLNATDIPAEKTGFTSELTTTLIANGIPYEKIDYAGKLTDEGLTTLDQAHDYVFIPTSHSREALMRILPALESYRASNETATLFGYPEWIVLQGDIKERLHRLNTTIYSRFASNPLAPGWKNVADIYEETYGSPLDRSTPVSALLGYDTAAWILEAANSPVTETAHEGIQNSFRFVRVSDRGGYENAALYFINFTPAGSTEAILL